MSWYGGAAAAAAAIAAQYAYDAGQKASEIPVLDPVLTEFLDEVGITFYAFSEALDAIGIDLEHLMRTDPLTQESLADLYRKLLESEVAWLGNTDMLRAVEIAVEGNIAYMDATWGAVELQWHEWEMDAVDRMIAQAKAELVEDKSFWQKAWDVITDPFGETVDFWGDVFSGIGNWLEDNMLPWFEARAGAVVGVAGRILEKVW